MIRTVFLQIKAPSLSISSSIKNTICFTAIFLLSFFLGALLSLAYPEGICNGETSSYWIAQNHYSLFKPSALDWCRTPVYGFVLKICSKFSSPTAVNYWINTVLFSLNCGLVFTFGRVLFRSVKIGIALALSFLSFEFASMHMFFHHLQVAADPIFAELVLLGTLVNLIAWLTKQKWLEVIGYLALAIAISIKAIGFCLIPVFAIFHIFSWKDLGRSVLSDFPIVATSLILLCAPVIVLSLRNALIYGSLKPNGHAGVALLQSCLPLISDQDKILDDPAENQKFIRITKRSTAVNAGIENLTGAPDSAVRNFQYKQYFLYGYSTIGPFDYLGHLDRLDPDKRWLLMTNSPKMFALDKTSKQLALHIISLHPVAYLNRVFLEYKCLFSPLDLGGMYWLEYNRDPGKAYEITPICPRESLFAMYPHRGSPDLTMINKWVANAIADLRENPLMKGIFTAYYASEFWLSHLIALAAAFFCWHKRSDYSARSKTSTGYGIAIAILLLFAIAASQFLATALVEVATPRYSVSSGELELHLLFLIAAFATAQLLVAHLRSSTPKAHSRM